MGPILISTLTLLLKKPRSQNNSIHDTALEQYSGHTTFKQTQTLTNPTQMKNYVVTKKGREGELKIKDRQV